MVVEYQNVDYKFGQGIDTKSDSYQIPFGKLANLINCRIQKIGQLCRRQGFLQFPNAVFAEDGSASTLPAEAMKSAVHDDQLLITNGESAYSYSPSELHWRDMGTGIPSVTCTTEPVACAESDFVNPDIAIGNGIECIVYAKAAAVHCVVRDTVTGVTVLDDVLTTAGAYPKVIPWINATTPSFVVFWIEGNQIQYTVILASNPALHAPGTAIAVTHDVISLYDVCTVGQTLYLLWVYQDATNHWPVLNVSGFQLDMTYGGTTWWIGGTGTTQCAPDACSIAASATSAVTLVVILGYHTITGLVPGLNARQVALDLLSAGAAVSLAVPTAYVRHIGQCPRGEDPATQAVLYDEAANPLIDTHTLRRVNYDLTGNTATAARLMRYRANMVSKPFAYGNCVYIPIACQDQLLSWTHAVITDAGHMLWPSTIHLTQRGEDISSFNVGLATERRTSTILAETPANSATERWIVAERRGNLSARNGQVVAAIGVAKTTLEFADHCRHEHVRLGTEVLFAGGCMQRWDGRSITEESFLAYPEATLTSQTSTSPGVPAGKYWYRFTYQWTDDRGLVHESAPSTPTEVTVTGNQTVAWAVYTLQRTKKSNVRIVMWRTEEITTSASYTYYRCTPTEAATGEYSVVSVADLSTATLSDNGAGFSTSNEYLYTTGGVLPNLPCSPCDRICTYKNRAWVRGTDGKNLLWYSKSLVPGHPVEWNDTLFVRVDERYGIVTAIATLEDRLLLFTDQSVYLLSGDGPNNAGQNNDLGEPQLITSDVGCSNPCSIVAVPDGIMFQSSKGIYKIDRGYERGYSVSYVGAPVEAYNSYQVVGAVLMPDVSEVRFATTGPSLFYSYLFDQWSLSVPGIGSTWAGLSHASIWRGQMVVLETAGRVFYETATGWWDNVYPTTMTVETGWLSFAGLQGLQRVRDFLLLTKPLNTTHIPQILGTNDLVAVPLTTVHHTTFIAIYDGYEYQVTVGTPVDWSAYAAEVQAQLPADLVFTLDTSSPIPPWTYIYVHFDCSVGHQFRLDDGIGTPLATLGIVSGSCDSSVAHHTIEIAVAYDYSTVWETAVTFDSDNVADTSKLRVFLTKPKCESLKIRIKVTPDGPASPLVRADDRDPCTLSGITFSVGILKGKAEVARTRRVSA